MGKWMNELSENTYLSSICSINGQKIDKAKHPNNIWVGDIKTSENLLKKSKYKCHCW